MDRLHFVKSWLYLMLLSTVHIAHLHIAHMRLYFIQLNVRAQNTV